MTSGIRWEKRRLSSELSCALKKTVLRDAYFEYARRGCSSEQAQKKKCFKKKKKEGKNQKEFLNWVVASARPPGLCRVFYQEGKGWGKNSGNL